MKFKRYTSHAMPKAFYVALLLFGLVIGCSGVPVRQALQEDLGMPAGKIEGDQFTGMRYPFKVSVPSTWKMATGFPDFLEDLGYDKPRPQDREQTELYIYNPETRSSIQFDFTPAGRYSVFSQERIERLTTAATGSLQSEIEKDYGKDTEMEIGLTEPISLKGVQFAAKKYAIYTINGMKREQGWIFGFSEPYQIFILYLLLEKEGTNDLNDMKKILDSFKFVSTK